MAKKRRIDDEAAACPDKASLIELAIRRGYPRPELWAEWKLFGRERRAKRLAQSTQHMKGRPW
jgi:hypothetical protein